MRTPSTPAVKYWFDYLTTSGLLIWKHSTGNRIKGDVAGSVDPDTGYIKIKMQGVSYYAHRLVWVWHGNELHADKQIDHIDKDRSNNRIENLKLGSR